MNQKPLNRRKFVRQSTHLAFGASTLSVAPHTVIGANETHAIGIIGCGRRGRNALMQEIFTASHKEPAVITAVCDIWKQQREKAVQMTQKRYGQAPQTFVDYQELLDQANVDAVVIATPEHQHIPMLMAAIQAGKDVYIEKPLAMNLDELNHAADLVRGSDRVVQVGTQLRSWPSFAGCRKMVQNGGLGEVHKISQIRNSYQPYWFRYKRDIKPADTHWDKFLMHRQARPFDADQHTAWYGYREFSLGPITSLMAHFIDLVHFITGAKFPNSAVTMMGNYVWQDRRTVPDSVHTVLDYPEGFMVSYSTAFGNGGGNQTRFFGQKGLLDATDWREPFITGDGSEHADRIKEKQAVEDAPSIPHMLNWLQCLRTRQKPNADIEAGYQHAVACLLADEAWQQNHRMRFDPKSRTFHKV